ncbi:MAG: hypothetical protein U0903_05020 [Planctomycetales bacterium]
MVSRPPSIRRRGEPIRKPTRIPNTSQMLASPVYGDGKIYIPGDNGVVVVVKDGPKYEVLGTNDLGEAARSAPRRSARMPCISGRGRRSSASGI